MIGKGKGRVRLQNKVFISYRREDSSGHVGRLYDRLVARIGKSRVLRDIDTIPFGADFEKRLECLLQESSVFLVVIGDKWMSLLRDRQTAARDYVRFEVANALRTDCVVIPVLVGSAQMPTPVDLEVFPDILPLTSRNALTMREDINFDNDFLRLLKAIEPRRLTQWKISMIVGCWLFIILAAGLFVYTKLVPTVEAVSKFHTEEEISSGDLPIPTADVEKRIPDLFIGGLGFIWVDPTGETTFSDEADFKALRKELETIATEKVSKIEGFYLQRDQFDRKDFRIPTDGELKDRIDLVDPSRLPNLSSSNDEITRISKSCQNFLFGDSKPAALGFRLPTVSEWRFAASDVLLARIRNSKTVQSNRGFNGFFNGFPELVATDEPSIGYKILGVETDDKNSFLIGHDIKGAFVEGSARFTERVRMRLLLPGGDKSSSSTVYINNKTDEELLIVAYQSGNEGKKLEQSFKTWPVSPGRGGRLELRQLGLYGWYWIVIYSRVMDGGKSMNSSKRIFRERVAGWCHFGYLDFSILEVENHGETLRFDSVLFR